MKKALKIVLIGVLALTVTLAVAFTIIIHNWRQTPHGKLDTKTAILLKLMNRQPQPESFNPLAMRYVVEQYGAMGFKDAVELPLVKDIEIPGEAGIIPARLYAPLENQKLPGIVFYHGGGWVTGSVNVYDKFCRRLALENNAVVVSVDYRLAPEHPFPAAIEDAYTALVFVNQNADKLNMDASRIAVAGDSAGGNLAAVACLMARDKKGPEISYQILMYPVTNVSSTNTESYKNFSEGYFISKKATEQMIGLYATRPEDKKNPYASPLLAKSHKNLPPALVITAEFDPLRDEGEAYADELEKSGVPVTRMRAMGTIHGFMSYSKFLDQADAAAKLITSTLKEAYQQETEK